LLSAAAFDRVFKKATRSRDKLFTVLCRESKDEIARLGLAISKKHCRKASTRNRIKRVIRESFRQHPQQLAGLDIVVINQPAATMADNGAMNESLERHWQRCTKAKQKTTEQDS
jgi:ribonuclease P protein component